MAMRSVRGVTLIELMTAVVIVGILTLVAAPAFTKIVALQRIKSAASNLQVALLTARSEGIKRNGNVTVASLTNNVDWSGGWTVTDAATSTVIGTYPGYSNLVVNGPAAGVTYQSSGRISATTAASFKVSSSSITDFRCVNITVMGVPTVTTSGC
jgi:type IV fimbrial biogenesis protein FimT